VESRYAGSANAADEIHHQNGGHFQRCSSMGGARIRVVAASVARVLYARRQGKGLCEKQLNYSITRFSFVFEKALGLEVAAFLDRDATTISKNSINFIDFVAVPLFQLLGKLYPDFDEQVVTLLTLNRRLWEQDAKVKENWRRKIISLLMLLLCF
jgi:hypothetical protein